MRDYQYLTQKNLMKNMLYLYIVLIPSFCKISIETRYIHTKGFLCTYYSYK